jgi:hypothetical protein
MNELISRFPRYISKKEVKTANRLIHADNLKKIPIIKRRLVQKFGCAPSAPSVVMVALKLLEEEIEKTKEIS